MSQIHGNIAELFVRNNACGNLNSDFVENINCQQSAVNVCDDSLYSNNAENGINCTNSLNISNDHVASQSCQAPAFIDYVQLQNGKVPDFSSKGLKFAHINIRSLSGKIDEFRYMCGNLFDVICVNETFCDETISDDTVNLYSYNILRRDRNRDGGGVALLIKDNYSFKRRDDLCNENVECIWVEISPPHTRPILICAVYNPDGKNYMFSNLLSIMLSNASTEDKEIVLLGDFNCDFTPNVISKEVRDLKSVSNMHQLDQLITLPTRITPHSRTIIDLFFTSNSELYDTSGVIQTAISDHFMIYAIRRTKPTKTKSKHKTINYRPLKDLDEQMFVTDLQNLPRYKIENTNNVNDALNMWESMFHSVIDRHIPKKSKRVKSAPSPWLTHNIKQKMYTRDYLHRKAIRSNDTCDWDVYKAARNQVTAMLRKAKSDYYRDKISHCSNSSELWKELKDVIPSKGLSIPSSITHDNNVLMTDDDMSNGFNNHFVNVATNLIKDNCNNVNNDTISNGNMNVDVMSNTCPQPEFKLPIISNQFVDKEIRLMSNNKATGLDDVSSKILKLARPAIVNSLTYIINVSLTSGVFPNKWKEARVTPLHKGGDLSNTNNYRPISILTVVSKIIEKAVHGHLYSYVSSHGMINEHQSGFRPGHSTETALVNMVDDWLVNINKGKMTGVVLIDLKKAFDTVNHDILLKKLRNIGICNTSGPHGRTEDNLNHPLNE